MRVAPSRQPISHTYPRVDSSLFFHVCVSPRLFPAPLVPADGAINTIQFMDMAVYAGSASTAPIISSGIVASCSSVKTGDTVIFSLVANDPNNLPLYYSWSFGDVTHSRFSSPRVL